MDTTLQQRMSLSQHLAPRMIQAMKILQMPIMALQKRVQHELLTNPVLELKESGSDDPEAGEATEAEMEEFAEPVRVEDERDPGAEPLVIDDKGGNEQDFDRLDALARDWEDHFNEEHRPSRNSIDEEIDRKHDAMQNMASRPQSLQDYLNDQLAFLDLPDEQMQLVRYLISHIDDNGFLSVPDESEPEEKEEPPPPPPKKKHEHVLDEDEEEEEREEREEKEEKKRKPRKRRYPSLEELALGYDHPVSVDEIEDALHVIQKLDPPGVGARDLRECLLLQVTPETSHSDLVRQLIMNHLEDITHNRLPAIEKKTHHDIATIKEAIHVLEGLNPRPGAQYMSQNIPYVVPDVLVERDEETGDYTVRLLDDWVPNVYISRRYIELYREKGGDPRMREYLKGKLQRAQWLQDSIEQRRHTLEKVTRAIIQHQRPFLDKGPEYIQPLKMQQIADQVGVHVTTVSRAVDDKWVQTPRGIFPLKRFFGGGREVAPGEEVAWEVIKQKLLEIIDQEDKANPFSDEELVEKMNQAGYPIKRRTITKYRKMANIPSSRERKDWTALSK
jgi:RNA polymerase sigma-54 factor